MTRYDALVIGAGPAGATAALLLARRGMKVAIAEKSAFPRRKVCGEFISATTWPLLRDLGVADEIAAYRGPPVDRVGLFAGDEILEAPMPRIKGSDSIIGVRPSPMMESDPFIRGSAVPREILDTALLVAAARRGAEVFQPFAVTHVERGAQGFTVTMQAAGGRSVCALQAGIVVAAHGSWERGDLPSHAARSRSRAGDLLGFKASYFGAQLAAGLMPLVLFPGGYGGMVHGAHGHAGFSCCIRRDALAACRRRRPELPAGEAVIAHVIASCRGVREALDGATRDGPWLSAGPIRPGARALQREGYYVAGNAAGEAHPLIAEGISMAIQSAWLLDERLAGGGYARAWRSKFSTRLAASSLFATLTMSPFTDAASVALMRSAPRILTWGARLGGKAA